MPALGQSAGAPRERCALRSWAVVVFLAALVGSAGALEVVALSASGAASAVLQAEGSAGTASAASGAIARLVLKGKARSAARTLAAGGAGDPKDAGFFGVFSEGESTFDADAMRGAQRKGEVSENSPDDPYKEGMGVHPAVWYHESASLGERQALQTHYPALAAGASGQATAIGQWRVDGSGRWVEEYPTTPVDGGPKGVDPVVKSAGWFEADNQHLDGYGRAPPPMPNSLRRMVDIEGWSERSVNTTIACAKPGCNATVSLQAFNPKVEKAQNCKISLFMHPTDFDDQYSGERVTFIKANGVSVSDGCFPMVSGCNASTQGPMFPCLREFPVDTLMAEDGSLEISAAISDVVDECPYNGNLLSGVPMVTCLIQPITTTPLRLASTPPPVLPAVPAPLPQPKFVYLRAPFRCPQRGCSAGVEFQLNQTGLPFERCLLGVHVNQTDFDGDDGTVEQIEFVKVNEVTLAGNMTPGANPCRSKWQGKPLSAAQIVFSALKSEDVTTQVLAYGGRLRVQVKITDKVDECAYEGYLLTGYAEVNCTLAGPNDQPQKLAQEKLHLEMR
mmetsp:Transcript_129846/g.416656  ORF Transcript_129846/g.416656 Transcript_129846/m.416656 type:complete len:562 (+) Transcript_129846:137-1822(+)